MMSQSALLTEEKGNLHSVSCQKCSLYTLCFADEEESLEPDSDKFVRRHRTIQRGEFLFRTQEPLETITAICSGSIKSSLAGENGEEQIVGFHFPGETVGLSGLGRHQHLYNAIALETTRVCEIPLTDLTETTYHSPSLHQLLFKLLGTQIADSHDLMMPLVGKKSAAEQLAAYLVGLSQRFEKRGFPSRQFRLSMSRSDISSYLGLAKETISRLFSQFQRQGLIRVRGRSISVEQPDKLIKLANSC